jgi:nicotinamide-nucleotide amidase
MTCPDRLRELAEQAGKHLFSQGRRLATAESCTGGWLAKTLTDLAGSSQWFERGYVTYSNAAKVGDLKVSVGTLERHGAVSEETAREMAAGALVASGADVAIAITGVAGPSGGSADKPVGTVWFAVAVRGSGGAIDLDARRQNFPGDRDAIRRESVRFALELLVAIQVLPKGTTV